jgi:hypothetical protein
VENSIFVTSWEARVKHTHGALLAIGRGLHIDMALLDQHGGQQLLTVKSILSKSVDSMREFKKSTALPKKTTVPT